MIDLALDQWLICYRPGWGKTHVRMKNALGASYCRYVCTDGDPRVSTEELTPRNIKRLTCLPCLRGVAILVNATVMIYRRRMKP